MVESRPGTYGPIAFPPPAARAARLAKCLSMSYSGMKNKVAAMHVTLLSCHIDSNALLTYLLSIGDGYLFPSVYKKN